jgi:hypothetical protein
MEMKQVQSKKSEVLFGVVDAYELTRPMGILIFFAYLFTIFKMISMLAQGILCCCRRCCTCVILACAAADLRLLHALGKKLVLKMCMDGMSCCVLKLMPYLWYCPVRQAAGLHGLQTCDSTACCKLSQLAYIYGCVVCSIDQ